MSIDDEVEILRQIDDLKAETRIVLNTSFCQVLSAAKSPFVDIHRGADPIAHPSDKGEEADHSLRATSKIRILGLCRFIFSCIE